MKETKKSGERGMSNCCARYHEVDWMLTLIVEGQCSRLSGIIVCDLRLSAGIAIADWGDDCSNVYCLVVEGRVLASRTLASELTELERTKATTWWQGRGLQETVRVGGKE